MSSLPAAVDPDLADEVVAFLRMHPSFLADNPELYRFVARHPLVGPDEQPADFASVVAELLGEQLAAHLRRGGLDPSYSSPWAEAIVGFINAASLWWLDHPEAMTRRQLGDYLSALLWGGAAGVHQLAGQAADPRPAPGIFPVPAEGAAG